MPVIEKIKSAAAAFWIFLTGLTLAQINTMLGFVSLVIGISYQLWKWKREAKK